MTIDTATKVLAEDDEDDEEAVELIRLVNIRVTAAGMVDRAANRAEFFALKRDEKGESEKQAPRDDMSNQQLHAAQESRSEEYGIEVLEGAALTFPADFPTTLKEYGDPVNLAYPLDTEDRARNARVRFKQFADQTYSDDKSKAVVHERIVRAELAMEIVPSYDPDDKLDAMLPADLREKMEAAAGKAEKGLKMDPKAQIQELIAAMTIGEPLTEDQLAELEAVADAIGAEPPPEPGDEAEPPVDSSDQDSESEQMAAEPEEMAGEGVTEEEMAAEKAASERQRAREVIWAVLDAINDGDVASDEDQAMRDQILVTIREAVSQKLGVAQKQSESESEHAREIIWAVLDAIDTGAVDSEEDKELRDKIIAALREAVSQKLEASHKAGRPQFNKARVAKLKEAFDSLKEMLEEIGELAAAAVEKESTSQKSDPTAEIDGLKTQLASLDSELTAAREQATQQAGEIQSLKADAEAVASRAAPPTVFSTEGQPFQSSEPAPKKRNKLNLQIRDND